MASYKKSRVNEEMLRETSQIIRTVKDPRVNSGFVTVTHCDVSGDLKFAKIYYSVMDGDASEVRKGLISAKGYIRREIASRLNLRNTPELTFIPDESIERGAKITKIIKDMNLPELPEFEKTQGTDL
ncbi:MAG: 30S ribosome-binding factor RbfA [Oscillospiraceae bacterium]|nr:30S ribosome-binding factor RbfA [Oscillospiraceae bacterium]